MDEDSASDEDPGGFDELMDEPADPVPNKRRGCYHTCSLHYKDPSY